MYWTEAVTGNIERVDLDGKNVEDLVTGFDDVHGLALDFPDSDADAIRDSTDNCPLASEPRPGERRRRYGGRGDRHPRKTTRPSPTATQPTPRATPVRQMATPTTTASRTDWTPTPAGTLPTTTTATVTRACPWAPTPPPTVPPGTPNCNGVLDGVEGICPLLNN